jgi:hypothetical protein
MTVSSTMLPNLTSLSKEKEVQSCSAVLFLLERLIAAV